MVYFKYLHLVPLGGYTCVGIWKYIPYIPISWSDCIGLMYFSCNYQTNQHRCHKSPQTFTAGGDPVVAFFGSLLLRISVTAPPRSSHSHMAQVAKAPKASALSVEAHRGVAERTAEWYLAKRYTREDEHGSWEYNPGKGETSSKPPFSGSMLILGMSW